MPASLAPITPELLKDLQDGKESALEQLFRPNFDELSKEAAERLDGHLAQKVVGKVFLELWERRAEPKTPSQLEALLREILGAGVSLEVRRHAALRPLPGVDAKAHSGVKHADMKTADQVWALIVGDLHAVKVDPKERARELAERRRHETAAHMAKVSKQRVPWTAIVIAVVLATAVGIPLYLANRGAEMTKAGQALAKEDARSMRAQSGQRGTVKLEEGTEVHLGSGTEVKLTRSFPRDFRATQVNGTALFKVPAGGTSPLLIHVGNAWVAASGADVMVRGYPDDSGVALIKVTNGSVTVQAGEVKQKSVSAGQMLMVNKDATMGDVSADLAVNAFSWIDGNFVTQNLPLRKVLVELKKWYGLDITSKDTSIMNRPITMTASLESKMDGVEALETAGGVKLGFEGISMVLFDSTAKVANPVSKPKRTKKGK